jgi:2-methylisocitrate lyase-like PEP mutase family enzyme
MTMTNASDVLRAMLAPGRVLHAPGVVDPLTAKVAADAGHGLLYLSGAAASAVILGEPDLGFITGVEIAELGHRITRASGLPLIADADTGYGNAVHVGATVRRYAQAGIAGLHLEDQALPKRCGHMKGKSVIEHAEAVQKVAAAVEASAGRTVIIARTDAWSVAGPQEAIRRAADFARAGADLVFVEGAQSSDDLAMVREGLGDGVGLVLNRSESAGDVAAATDTQLAALDVRVVIHPVSALLAMAQAAQAVYAEILQDQQATTTRMAWDSLNTVLGLDRVLADEQRYGGLL